MNAMYAGSEDSAAGPRTDIIVKIAVRMIGTIVDAVDLVTDIFVRAVKLRIDIVGRGADLVTIIIVSVITPTTDIATSLDP